MAAISLFVVAGHAKVGNEASQAACRPSPGQLDRKFRDASALAYLSMRGNGRPRHAGRHRVAGGRRAGAARWRHGRDAEAHPELSRTEGNGSPPGNIDTNPFERRRTLRGRTRSGQTEETFDVCPPRRADRRRPARARRAGGAAWWWWRGAPPPPHWWSRPPPRSSRPRRRRHRAMTPPGTNRAQARRLRADLAARAGRSRCGGVAKSSRSSSGRSGVMTFLAADGFIPRVVVTVDNLARPMAASRLWPVQPDAAAASGGRRRRADRRTTANATSLRGLRRLGGISRAAALYWRLPAVPAGLRRPRLGYPPRPGVVDQRAELVG